MSYNSCHACRPNRHNRHSCHNQHKHHNRHHHRNHADAKGPSGLGPAGLPPFTPTPFESGAEPFPRWIFLLPELLLLLFWELIVKTHLYCIVLPRHLHLCEVLNFTISQRPWLCYLNICARSKKGSGAMSGGWKIFKSSDRPLGCPGLAWWCQHCQEMSSSPGINLITCPGEMMTVHRWCDFLQRW